jgi:sortase (surface protein transpeptidase)
MVQGGNDNLIHPTILTSVTAPNCPAGQRHTMMSHDETGAACGTREESRRSGGYTHHRCTLLCQMAVGSGSAMGYSGTAAPAPELTCLPDDWWDPAWQLMKLPEAREPAPAAWVRTEVAAPATVPQTQPPKPPPAWGQVLAATLGLWTSRRLPWLRRAPGRRLAALALGAGLAAVAVGSTGLAAAALSPKHAAQLPARPSPLPAPSGRTVLPASLSAAQQVARPAWLSIPVIGVRTSLVDLGLRANGTLQVPSSTAVAGWYTGSPRPGTVGAAVIAGHVDSRSGLGIFFWLRELRRGDRVYVGRADGTMAVFAVTAVRKFAKDLFPTAAVYGSVPDPELRLITCGGVFDRSLGSYLSNVVVFARLSG